MSGSWGTGIRERLGALGNTHSRGDGGPLDDVLARIRRPLDRAYLRRNGRLPSLYELGRSRQNLLPAPARARERVLVLTLRGWPNHAAYESVIAHALALRGAEVGLLACGGGQPLCELGWSRRAYPRPCDRCAHYSSRILEASRLPSFRLADAFDWGDDGRGAPASAEAVDAPGLVDPREATTISAPWFLRTTNPGTSAEARAVAADFDVSAAGVEQAAARVLDRFQPTVVFMVNGLFAAEHVVRELALARGARAPTYEIAPRENALVFGQEVVAPAFDTNAVWERVADQPLATAQAAALDRLLTDRARGIGAHESYYDDPEEDLDAIRRELGIGANQRVVSLYTNLSWDSAALYQDAAYGSMLDWVEAAVRSVSGLPETVLVVRIHPAEARWGTREHVRETVERRIDHLPANVRFIEAEQAISSYTLLDLSDLVLAYTSTIGLEGATRGLPVAVAGLTHYRGRGFTLDVSSHSELEAALAEPPPVSPETVERARRYAFTFFFRAMIPFPVIQMVNGRPVTVPSTIEDLMPGQDPYLDFVCERILDGGDFTLPDELAVPA